MRFDKVSSQFEEKRFRMENPLSLRGRTTFSLGVTMMRS
jgi:hypothetical protein